MHKMKKVFGIIILITVCVNVFGACKKSMAYSNDNMLYVYNWGLYIDDITIEKFEKETGITVVYDMFDTNEEMYAKLVAGGENYDILCPTDYMIEKLIKEDKLYSFNITKLENYKYLDKNCLSIMKTFDEKNEYAVPYVYSTLGIIYNKTLLDKKNLPYPKSFEDLFLEQYKNEIVLQDAVRDVLMLGLKKNKFSLNSTNDEELKKAEEDLIKQKPLIYAYLIDDAREKMAIGETSIATMYSGEVEYISENGGNLGYEYEYVLPDEGVNITFDCWCIPKNSNNKENAIKWIDFMTRPDIAKINYEYMHYGIPNTKVREMLPENERNNKTIFPDFENNNFEIYKDLGEYNEIYSEIWKRIKSA